MGLILAGWQPEILRSPVEGKVVYADVYPMIYKLQGVLYLPGGDRRISEPSTIWFFLSSNQHF